MAGIAIGAVFMCCVCTAVGGGGYLYTRRAETPR